MSDKAKEEVTLTDEENEVAKKLWNEADKASRELHQLLQKAVKRHRGSSGSAPIAFAKLPTVERIRDCDENGKNCYCWERKPSGEPGPIRPCP